MEAIKAMKKQKILNTDIIKFNIYLYHDKANANVYGLFDQSDCYILRYDKNTKQFKTIHFDHLPTKPFQYTESNHINFLDEYTSFKNEYNKRKNTSNPRYDNYLRVILNTRYTNYRGFKAFEKYFDVLSN